MRYVCNVQQSSRPIACIELLISINAFPGGSVGKESACNAGDLGLIPGLGRSPRGGLGNFSSILAWRVPMNRETWPTAVRGVAKSWT